MHDGGKDKRVIKKIHNCPCTYGTFLTYILQTLPKDDLIEKIKLYTMQLQIAIV